MSKIIEVMVYLMSQDQLFLKVATLYHATKLMVATLTKNILIIQSVVPTKYLLKRFPCTLKADWQSDELV